MSEIRVDTISEKTSANGVAIDGLTIKDGGISATTGAIVFNEASADLDFRVESNGNTHMLFVDGGSNIVGIGTDPDLGVGLHIKSADSGGSATSTADELVVEGSGDTGIQILSGASSEAGIAFGDSGDSNIGLIGYDHANNRFRFKTNDAVQWYLDSSGNWLPAATDHGIYLGVTSATASNLLNDYEIGTWTPTFNGTAGAPSGVSYNRRVGWYEKVGDMVAIHCYLDAASMTSVPSGGLTITGLPFTTISTTEFYHAATVGYSSNFATTESPQAGYLSVNATLVNMVTNASNDARDNLNDTVTCANAMSGNEALVMSATYRTA